MSPVINPDLSEVGPIEPGTYKAKVIKCDAGTSGKGNPKIVPTFEVEVDGEVKSREAHIVTSGPGAFTFSQLLRACGLDGLANQYEDKSQPNPPFNTDELIGSVLSVVIDENMYEGQKRDQITAYLKA